MKRNKIFFIMLAVLLVVSAGLAIAQEEMTKEQWQLAIDDFTKQRTDLTAKLKSLTDEVTSMQAQSTQLKDDYSKKVDDLYALVGSDKVKAEAYRSQIDGLEAKANELARLSDADLVARTTDVEQLGKDATAMWDNKLSLIPEFWDRLTALNDKVKSLKDVLAAQVKVYTVGTWARDRDCLWNISKKKDIYDNAWLWPKIWQGNRDQNKDPDIIHTGQKLMIPKGNELTSDEKSAARKYYSHKAQAAAPAAK